MNKLVLAADLGLPTGDFADAATVGGGVMAKLLFGVTPAGDITATTGVTLYPLKKDNLGLAGFDDFERHMECCSCFDWL